MRVINNDGKTVLECFDELMDAKRNGEEAKFEYGGYVNTTADIPDNFEDMDYHEVIRLLKVAAFRRNEKQEAMNMGYTDERSEEEMIRDAYEQDGEAEIMRHK